MKETTYPEKVEPGTTGRTNPGGQTGQLNRYSKQFGGSATRGGQAPVTHRVEGDRRDGRNAERGYVSPLGGADFPYKTNTQQGEERRERPGTGPGKDRY